MKTEFNPKDVPSWCKWIAVDKDGLCCAYSTKPKAGTRWGAWDNDYNYSGTWSALYRGASPKNFKDELYTWK